MIHCGNFGADSTLQLSEHPYLAYSILITVNSCQHLLKEISPKQHVRILRIKVFEMPVWGKMKNFPVYWESDSAPENLLFCLVGIIRGANGCNSSLKLGEDFYFPMILSVHSRAEWLKRIVQTALILHQIILCHLSWDYRSLTSTGSLRNSHK